MLGTISQLSHALKTLGLGEYEAAIAAVAKPALSLDLENAVDSEIAVGSSKFGGDPDLALDIAWPTKVYRPKHVAAFEVPLQFMVQFDLAELTRYETASVLPKSGLLSFFYDMYEQPWGSVEDRGAWHALYQAKTDRLERRISPPPPQGYEYHAPLMRRLDPRISDGYDKYHIIPRRIAYTEYVSLPRQNLFTTLDNIDEYWDAETAGFDVSIDDKPKLLNLYEAPPERSGHQLLGTPAVIQNAMEGECEQAWRKSKGEDVEYVDVPPGSPTPWRLLLQIDSYFELMWRDDLFLDSGRGPRCWAIR